MNIASKIYMLAKSQRMITLHPTSVMDALGRFNTANGDECGAVLLYLPCFQDHSYLVRCEHGDWVGTFNQSRTLFDDSFKRIQWIGYYKEYLSRQSGLTFSGGNYGSSYCTLNIGRGSERTFCYKDTTTGEDIIRNGVILSDDVVPIVI